MSVAQVADAATQDAAEDKRFKTLRARGCRSGVETYRTTDDHDRQLYIAVKWAMTRHFESLDALAAWLHQVDGRAE